MISQRNLTSQETKDWYNNLSKKKKPSPNHDAIQIIEEEVKRRCKRRNKKSTCESLLQKPLIDAIHINTSGLYTVHRSAMNELETRLQNLKITHKIFNLRSRQRI